MRNTRCLLILATLALSCDSSGPTAPAAPPKVLPQAPMSCTYRVDGPYFDDRVGWFPYDIRWFPPEQQGSDPVTSYEVQLIRAAVTGESTPEGYRIVQNRNMPEVKRTVRAKTGTTNDLHSVEDIATFPICELLSRGEDLLFQSNVRATSAAGMSLAATCVDAERLWDGIVLFIHSRGDYWRHFCGAAGSAPVGQAPEWVRGLLPPH